ncbi:imm11 family protein [Paenibacillus sp. NPDC058071]|uniref:imm11 family protein n=1 Tax=Paenibacillus sp. NPDC058071 TaxID=3346326 RepID=UPI0036DA4CEE
MDYFILKQDERYANTPTLLEVRQKIDSRNVNRFQAGNIPDTVVFQVAADAESQFLDILDRQLFLVSDKLKRVIEMYAPGTLFKMIPLIDARNRKQQIYYMPIFEEVEALGPSSELNLDRSVIKKLVLRREKVQGKKIFALQEGEQTIVIVRLDVAESIMRRGFTGTKLVRAAME